MKILSFTLLILISNSLLGQSEFTFVFLNKKENKLELPQEQVDKLMEGHMANINRLAEDGKLLAAGPFDGGGGIFVFKSNSVDEVKGWVNTDPAVKANRWDVEILPYQSIVGSICKVSAPYEMVSYNFIRFQTATDKSKTPKSKKLVTVVHESYWKNRTEPIITFASFGKSGGNILVSTTAIDDAVLQNDPAIAKGLITVEKKMLWIAKGAFCESRK